MKNPWNKTITFDRFVRWILIALLVVGILLLLRRLSSVLLPFFIGWFIAYLMNPLAMFYERKLFRKSRRGKWGISVFLAFITFVAVIAVLLLILIPQLVNSILSLMDQLPEYQTKIHSLLQDHGIRPWKG